MEPGWLQVAINGQPFRWLCSRRRCRPIPSKYSPNLWTINSSHPKKAGKIGDSNLMLHTFGKYCTSPCGSNPANGNGSLGLATTYAVEVVRHPIVWCCFRSLTTSVIAESPDFGVSRKHSTLTGMPLGSISFPSLTRTTPN